MAYRRFLNDADYLSTLTEIGFRQLLRERHDSVIDAEESAELSVTDYLHQHYLVEEALMVGKKIAPYNNQITYPPDVFFTYEITPGEEKIYRTLTSINSVKRPYSKEFWRELDAFEEIGDLEKIPCYSQMITWKAGSKVKYRGSVWVCINGNGIEFNNIQIPGITPWKKIDVYEWQENLQYQVYDVVKYKGDYYMLLDTADPETMDKSKSPLVSDDWGLIGEYVEDYEYEISDHEYVVCNDEVFYPVMQVNPDKPEVGVNMTPDDPRNQNLVKHMTRLAIYELHKRITPANISSVRINDYNDSIQWLRDAQKFRLDPKIERRIDEDEKYPYTGSVVVDFAKPMDPWKNQWFI